MASGESTYKEALGAMIVSSKTRRMLLQLRSRNKIWGFFGGKKKANETNKEALTREIMEETGIDATAHKIGPINCYTIENKDFKYHSFAIIVDDEFTPKLNGESAGYCWVKIDAYPKPLHVGAKLVLYDKLNKQKIKTLL